METIYLDNAATTQVKPAVVEAMLPYYTLTYGNPSSVHALGRKARQALDKARGQVAAALGATPQEIYFTGCGTESDNWAIKGAALRHRKKGNHIITSSIEHHAVLHTCQWLERNGFDVTYLPVDADGLVDPKDLEAAITPQPTLVSIMVANNEVGTIEPIQALAKIAHDHGALFHTDAVQAVGSVPVDVRELDVDLLSLSAHKFYGPKGVGALYVRKGIQIQPFLHGGAQERAQRAGTENLAAIAGMAEALTLATADLEAHGRRLSGMRDRMIAGLMEQIPDLKLNGHPTQRLPGNVNVSVRYVEGESLLLALDLEGIAASSGSACTSGSLDPSHVLLAMGLTHEIAHGSLRLSLGDFNTDADVDRVLDVLPKIVSRLRAMSPLFDDAKEESSCIPSK